MRTYFLALAACGALAGGAAYAQHPYGLPNALVPPRTAHVLGARPSDNTLPPTQGGDPAAVTGDPRVLHEEGGLIDDGGCGPLGGGLGACFDDGCPNWYAGVNWLYMARTDCGHQELSILQPGGGGFIDLIVSEDAAPDDWRGGLEATLAYRVAYNWWLSATWWFLDDVRNDVYAFSPSGGIDTPLNFAGLNFPNATVDFNYNNAQAHVLSRRSEFDSVEINLVNDGWMPCSSVRFSYAGGLRFFRFEDNLHFGSSLTSTTFGVDLANEAHYRIDLDNQMWGMQVGARVDWQPTCRFSGFVAPTIGIYNNHIENNTRIYRGDGVDAVRFDGVVANVSAKDDRFAVLSQIDIGARYLATCNLSAYAGYRLVVLSGVATTVEQIPQLGADIEGMADTDNCSTVFLHGVFAGIDYRW